MKIDAVGITTTNMTRTVEFYELLGFEFGEYDPNDDHLEPISPSGVRLMIDTAELSEKIHGERPRPSNQSQFAILYDSAEEVNQVAAKVEVAGYKIMKQPWDAFWGQRYCVVADPDGYMLDLFAQL